MLKKTITYTDYNGVSRTEDFYFHLSQAELLEMELGTEGTFTATVQAIVNAKDVPALIRIFKRLLLKSYGEKSLDGRQFIKSDEISKAFSETPAYSQFYMELATNDDAAAEFINNILPSGLDTQVAEQDGPKLLPPVQE